MPKAFAVVEYDQAKLSSDDSFEEGVQWVSEEGTHPAFVSASTGFEEMANLKKERDDPLSVVSKYAISSMVYQLVNEISEPTDYYEEALCFADLFHSDVGETATSFEREYASKVLRDELMSRSRPYSDLQTEFLLLVKTTFTEGDFFYEQIIGIIEELEEEHK